MAGFIGIHIGAGNYNEEKYEAYKLLINKACLQAKEILLSGGSAMDACCIAVKVLENDSLVNAGYGSNLTLEGNVECDASIMDGQNLNFGACGAVSGVKNPIALADYLCRQQTIECGLGLVHPCLLVGDGARRCAEKIGLELIDKDQMISETALHQHKRYKKYYKRYNDFVCKVTKEISSKDMVNHKYVNNLLNESEDFQKTDYDHSSKKFNSEGIKIDVLNFNCNGYKSKITDSNERKSKKKIKCIINVSDGSKSNSINKNCLRKPKYIDNIGIKKDHLKVFKKEVNKSKHKSLIDDLSTYEKTRSKTKESEKLRFDTVGAVSLDYRGHVASACSSGGVILKQAGRVGQAAIMGAGVWAKGGLAVSTTGCGEHLIRTQLAKEIANSLEKQTDSDLSDILNEQFLESEMLQNERNEKIAGAIVLNISVYEGNAVGKFLWSHTAYNMGVGYMQTCDLEPNSMISTISRKTHSDTILIPISTFNI